MADILPVLQQLRTGLKEAKSTGSLTLALVNQTIATCGSIIQTQTTAVEVKTEIVGLVQDMTVDAATNYEDLNKSVRDAFPDDIRIAGIALFCLSLVSLSLSLSLFYLTPLFSFSNFSPSITNSLVSHKPHAIQAIVSYVSCNIFILHMLKSMPLIQTQ
jgi:hypothetical protein